MTATVSSLEDFLAKRRAEQEALSPTAAPVPLVGMVTYSDGSWRINQQIPDTGEAWFAAFTGLAGACETLQRLYQERRK